jgi:ABC-2 type transport system ATP-binding protein
VPDPIILVDHLRKNFGSTVAVDGLSLSIPPGEIFGFLGANGAGKTTTIRMLCGLARPTSGHGYIDGRDIWKDRYRIRSKFGYVAQKFSLYPDLTVIENLRFFARACGVSGAALRGKLEKLILQMDLVAKHDERAGRLSGGTKQLLALACSLVHEPLLLFLDEPTSGLDPVHRQQIWDLLYALSGRGTTIFVSTHYMDEAERCTEVGFLHRGQLLAKDSPRNLKNSLGGRLLEVQVDPLMPALAQVRQAQGVLGVSLRSGSIRIYATDPQGLLAQWKERWPLPEVKWLGHGWAEPDMEDVFKAYSQGYLGVLSSSGRASS